MIEYNKELLLFVKPRSLREFYESVLSKPLPTIEERGKLFEEFGIGPANEYLGTAGQNLAILEMLYLLAEQSR